MDKDKIRIQRVIKKISQDELAKAAKVDRSYISMIETGKKTPSLAVLERIAKALDCSIKDFF
jgi:transcriptional regulator with XRE-family HTH domain